MSDSEKINELSDEINDLNTLIIFLLKNNYSNLSIRDQLDGNEKLSFDRILIKNWKKMGKKIN
jgi:hypothetical protein